MGCASDRYAVGSNVTDVSNVVASVMRRYAGSFCQQGLGVRTSIFIQAAPTAHARSNATLAPVGDVHLSECSPWLRHGAQWIIVVRRRVSQILSFVSFFPFPTIYSNVKRSQKM